MRTSASFPNPAERPSQERGWEGEAGVCVGDGVALRCGGRDWPAGRWETGDGSQWCWSCWVSWGRRCKNF